MNEAVFDTVKQFATDLLRIGKFDHVAKVDVKKDSDQALRVDVTIGEAGLAIGPNGEHLRAWEEVLERFASKQEGSFVSVTMDINNYRWQLEERLREIARHGAKEATFGRKEVKLPSMNAYERRIVHAELALRPDVHTESEGRDPNRCVVIKPLI